MTCWWLSWRVVWGTTRSDPSSRVAKPPNQLSTFDQESPYRVTDQSPKPLRIATRASQLALWQAHHVADLIRRANPASEVEIVEITTIGDRDLAQPLRDFGGLGVFTREVQVALLDGRADIAVHSLKDLPTESHPELDLAGIPDRANTSDALVLPEGVTRTHSTSQETIPLPQGARVATGSPRRQAQLLHLRPDLQLVEVRGNVQTRLRKLDAGEFDGMMLATAGLERLQLAHRICCQLGTPHMYYAVGQGALGLECRKSDEETRDCLSQLTHCETWAAATAERTLLAKLRAGCHAPVGVSCQTSGDELTLEGVVLTLDGRRRWMAAAKGSVRDPETLGATVADLLLSQGATV